jgi:hypothetical protein
MEESSDEFLFQRINFMDNEAIISHNYMDKGLSYCEINTETRLVLGTDFNSLKNDSILCAKKILNEKVTILELISNNDQN